MSDRIQRDRTQVASWVWGVFWGSQLKQVVELLVIGTSVGIVLTPILNRTASDFEWTPEVLLRAMPKNSDIPL